MLGQCFENYWPIVLGEGSDLRSALRVLGHELSWRTAAERQLASEHFLIDNCQAVLVSPGSGPIVEDFWRRVSGRKSADHRVASAPHLFDQTEIGHLDVVAQQKKILGLNVEMLQVVLPLHKV